MSCRFVYRRPCYRVNVGACQQYYNFFSTFLLAEIKGSFLGFAIFCRVWHLYGVNDIVVSLHSFGVTDALP